MRLKYKSNVERAKVDNWFSDLGCFWSKVKKHIFAKLINLKHRPEALSGGANPAEAIRLGCLSWRHGFQKRPRVRS